MDPITIIAIAFGLSFDTFAASLIFGITRSRILFFQAVSIALIMAFVQGGLTVAGYFTGYLISGTLNTMDHWIAFALLSVIGIKMIVEGLKKKNVSQKRDYTKPSEIIAVAFGTSIDAAAAGISFAILDMQIWMAGSIIGFVTFLASMTAIRIGKSVGTKAGRKTEIIGGIILIAIGIKILMEHLAG